MAALDFPLSPEDGDTHNNYVYDATHGVWDQNPQQLAARFISSDTAPTSPSTGDAWFDTETGKTYIYHDSSWVESGNPVIGYVDPYDQASTSTGYLALPKGTDAQRPGTPANGHIRFNTDSGEPEYYSETESAWFLFRERAISAFDVEYLVVAAGGGGGGSNSAYGRGAGAGAGALRSGTVSLIADSTDIAVSVGAGGTGSTNDSTVGTNGADSNFSVYTTTGGGAGGANNSNGVDGGSGGGGGGSDSGNRSGGTGVAGRGNDGGSGYPGGNTVRAGGGGGGSGAAGANAGNNTGGAGGVGSVSTIITSTLAASESVGEVSGSDVYFAGGGSGAGGALVSGGLGGGGDNQPVSGVHNGGTNTGGGAGGVGAVGTGGTGGSGVVIIKYPSAVNLTIGPGLTSQTDTDGDFKVTIFKAGEDDVSFS